MYGRRTGYVGVRCRSGSVGAQYGHVTAHNTSQYTIRHVTIDSFVADRFGRVIGRVTVVADVAARARALGRRYVACRGCAQVRGSGRVVKGRRLTTGHDGGPHRVVMSRVGSQYEARPSSVTSRHVTSRSQIPYGSVRRVRYKVTTVVRCQRSGYG